ncbi:hypothetical protein K474DRAFT_1704403 [Panus rudis PR-1116 ss-1]|nr:hypothetical protein K474DRAFT_1704403 [Panus rudis PR-1116 ss-1]
MLSALVYKENKVPELQRKIQAQHNIPIYYRKPHGKLYVRTYYGLFAAGMLGVVYGSFHLIKGKSANE